MKKDRLYTVDKGLASVVKKQAQPKNVFAFGGQDNARWDRLASRAYGAQYGDDGYTLSDYMNHKNGFGISRQNNPFSKGNIGGTLSAVSGVLAPMAANYISDGYSDGAANTFMAAGNAVGQAIGTVNPVAGAIITGASNVLGGLGNRAFGTKKNEGNINAITQNTAQAREAGNMLTGASTTSDLINAAGNMTGSMGFGTTDLVKGGWFSKGKARRQGQKFLNKENAALAYQSQGMMLGANNVDSTLDNMVMGNFAAYGGPFEMASRMPYTEQNNSNDMGAIEYGFMSDYLINKQRQAEMKNKVGGITSVPANMFSDGGIEIKHPGRLTRLKERTGKTEAELWAEGKPEVRKMITFARNSRKWKKAYGGLIDAIDKIDTIEKNLFPYGGGTFSGSGAGGSLEDSTDTYPEVTNFNEAFDNAVKAGLKEFTFQGRRYNTQKELNPAREYNNRWVGQGRRSDVKNPSKAYDRQVGPLRGAEALVPIVVNTYTGAENPEFPPMLDYDPNATEQLTSPFRSYAWERPKTIKPKKALGGPLFAFGGNMGTNSADFSTGLTHIDAGQSHELNPNEGVQVGVDNEGTPNLVEEGEVIFNDYVFSNRIGIDDGTKNKFHIGKKREMTYAELAKKLEKEIAERPNDPISKASFKAQMEQLAEQQERQKQEMEAERARQVFEALSDEEKVAVMQQAAQQEQAAQEAALQEQAAMEQQPVEQPVEQPSPEDMTMMQQQMQQAPVVQEQTQSVEAPVQMAMGGKLYPTGGSMNAGTWKTGDFSTNWNTYTRKGLKDYLQNIVDRINMAPDDATKNAIRQEAINTVSGIQQAYRKAWQKDLTPTEEREVVKELQQAFQNAGGNAYFSDIASNINVPKGADTGDRADRGWVDSLWGPRTSIRNWGSTEYGDEGYYQDIANLATQAGMVYAPNPEWVYGDNNQLYGLSIPEAEPQSAQPEDSKPDYAKWPTEGGAATGTAIDPAKQSPAQPKDEGDIVPVHRNEKLRYVGLLGPAVGLGMQALGIGRPDTRGLDASLELLNNGVALADYKPIGNYLRYRPMDIWAEQNRLNANARATDRAIQNSGSNQGAKIAGLLSNEYNNQIGSGELYRKALEYNDALRERQATFNRGTDQFNAEAYNRTALQNAEMLNRNRQIRAQLGLDVASQKMAADAAWNQGIYGNVAGLFKGIGDVGRENYQHNRIADMAATGIFGTIDPDTSFIANGYLTRRKKNSRGGKLNKGGRK